MLRAAVPYVVSWDDIGVQVLHADVSASSIPKLLNMSVVGLGQIQNLEKSSSKDTLEVIDTVLASTQRNHPKFSLNLDANELVPGASIGEPVGTANTNEKELELKSTSINIPLSTSVSTSSNVKDKTKDAQNDQYLALKPPTLVSQEGM